MSKKQPLTRKQKRLLKKRRRRRILFGIEIFILLILIAGVFIYAKLGKMNFTSLDFSKIGVNSGVSNNKVMKGYTTVHIHPGLLSVFLLPLRQALHRHLLQNQTGTVRIPH